MVNPAVDGRDHYQLDDSAPELYQRYLVPAVTALWAADLLARICLRSGERVLDVACGTGVVARGAAEQVGASGHVAAIDVNAAMLEVARRIDPPAGAPIAWQQASALDLPYDDGSFDVVLCQLGLQFFPGPGAALGQMRRVLVARGRLGLSVYSAIEQTPAALAHSWKGPTMRARMPARIGSNDQVTPMVPAHSGYAPRS